MPELFLVADYEQVTCTNCKRIWTDEPMYRTSTGHICEDCHQDIYA